MLCTAYHGCGKKHLLATVTAEIKKPSEADKADGEAYRLELEQPLHGGLDKRCLVTLKGNKIFVHVCGDFTEAQLDHLAQGVARIFEWEAA